MRGVMLSIRTRAAASRGAKPEVAYVPGTCFAGVLTYHPLPLNNASPNVKVLEDTADGLGGRKERQRGIGRAVEPPRLAVSGLAQARAADPAGVRPKV